LGDAVLAHLPARIGDRDSGLTHPASKSFVGRIQRTSSTLSSSFDSCRMRWAMA
jgi:hypothetical protein